MKTHPDTAFKILQLLLRCGMVCREELNLVLEMIPAIPGDAMEELCAAAAESVTVQAGSTAAKNATAPHYRRAPQPKPQSRQNTLGLIDNIGATD